MPVVMLCYYLITSILSSMMFHIHPYSHFCCHWSATRREEMAKLAVLSSLLDAALGVKRQGAGAIQKKTNLRAHPQMCPTKIGKSVGVVKVHT